MSALMPESAAAACSGDRCAPGSGFCIRVPRPAARITALRAELMRRGIVVSWRIGADAAARSVREKTYKRLLIYWSAGSGSAGASGPVAVVHVGHDEPPASAAA